jgi:hypothetical protein
MTTSSSLVRFLLRMVAVFIRIDQLPVEHIPLKEQLIDQKKGAFLKSFIS